MALLREDIPQFAADAICRGSRKAEIITDLTDAGVAQQSAERMVAELECICNKLRFEETEGLEKQVLQTWLSSGSPLEYSEAISDVGHKPPPTDPIFCLRCDQQLSYAGTKKFHEGTRAWGFVLGDLGELFISREHYDVYVCPRCGRLEFFVDGIGEQYRRR